MKFTLALLTAAAAVSAMPSGTIDLGDGVTLIPRQSTMQQRRAARKAATSPNVGKVDASYSSNWAGAVLIGSGYTKVSGTITVPKTTGSGAGSGWVGIDGDTCSTAIAQTGVDFGTSNGGYDAWYEWYPDYAYTFTGLSIKAGDQVSMSVTASSKTAGTVTVSNLSTGKSASHSFSNENTDPLCETNAEWIVEDFESNGALVPFANFGSVTFTNLSPSASGAEVLDIKQGNNVLTSCSASSSSVSCSYV